ncbi:hypothetical protein F0562_009404 [Nyssa sinensis]|uniref:Uncharacterized protein n=1 Tax=Nyssa sinensis TaxID=561372 RepID=A0A5J5A0U7_9ASTE|nr:hypothetical protein F0562_009404 [Nyssa sinensis]
MAQEFLSLASVTASSTHESVGKNGLESKYDDCREVQSEVGNSFSGANSSSTPSTLSNTSSILVGSQRSTHSNSASLHVSQGQFLEVEAPTHCSEMEQPKASLEHEKPFMPPPSDVPKQPMPTSDDDDLPEFDFGTACGISQIKMTKPLDAVMSDKRVPTEGTRKMDESMSPTMPIVRVTSVSNQRSDHSSLPRLPLASSQGLPLPKRICEHESQILVLSNLEEKQGVQSKTTPTPGPPRPWPILPSPSPAVTRLPFSSQDFPPAFQCPVTITVKAPQPRPFPRGPSPSMGFNPNLVLRPHQSSSDVKLPFHPADNRGWRPR